MNSKGDNLHWQAALATAGVTMASTTQKSMKQTAEAVKAVGNKVAAMHNLAAPILPYSSLEAGSCFAASYSRTPSFFCASTKPPVTASIVPANISTISTPQSETLRQNLRQMMKDDVCEPRPILQQIRQPEVVVPKSDGSPSQSKNMSATLQKLKTQASMAMPRKEGKTLEVDYQFQRWSGDHSVRISIVTEARQEGNVTLLPSDSRAADALLRNMDQLAGLPPNVLWTQHQDEQQQDEQQQDEQQE